MVAEVSKDTSCCCCWWGGWAKLRSQLVVVRRGLGFYGERTSDEEPTRSRDSSGLRLLIVVKKTR